MTTVEDLRAELWAAAVARDQQCAEQARIAADRLAEGDFSAAATACHRAYQHKLIAEALDKAADR